MSLSRLIFITDHTWSNRSRQLNVIFGIDYIIIISHVVVLFGFYHIWHPIRSVTIVQFRFQCRLHLHDGSCHYPIWFFSQTALALIGHDNSVSFWLRPHLYDWSHYYLFYFHRRPHPVRQVSTIQFHFRHRKSLYGQSRHYPIWFLLQIRPDRSITIAQFHFQHRKHLYDQSCSVLIQFSSQSTFNPIGHNSSILFSTYTTPVRAITSLSYPVLIMEGILSNWSQQLSFIFNIDHTCTISHIVVLSGFHHRSYRVSQVLIVQFWFRYRLDLYNWSHRYRVWFSSQIEPSSIGHCNQFHFWHRPHLYNKLHSCPIWFLSIDTQSKLLRKFSIVFGVDRTYTIGHVIVFIINDTRSHQ